ncbi:hypothetical protein MSAN_01900000 [Mycena sanguinolenta]|uniref:Uncharacterized protein n=1 Tax=Mycena sanguinolenta TaxID=230812 RepID=A0A8H7CPD5_9AGAR|nr:hypothetical protein MSAN_01900000 [Mycena sanguinolenta]
MLGPPSIMPMLTEERDVLSQIINLGPDTTPGRYGSFAIRPVGVASPSRPRGFGGRYRSTCRVLDRLILKPPRCLLVFRVGTVDGAARRPRLRTLILKHIHALVAAVQWGFLGLIFDPPPAPRHHLHFVPPLLLENAPPGRVLGLHPRLRRGRHLTSQPYRIPVLSRLHAPPSPRPQRRRRHPGLLQLIPVRDIVHCHITVAGALIIARGRLSVLSSSKNMTLRTEAALGGRTGWWADEGQDVGSSPESIISNTSLALVEDGAAVAVYQEMDVIDRMHAYGCISIRAAGEMGECAPCTEGIPVVLAPCTPIPAALNTPYAMVDSPRLLELHRDCLSGLQTCQERRSRLTRDPGSWSSSAYLLSFGASSNRNNRSWSCAGRAATAFFPSLLYTAHVHTHESEENFQRDLPTYGEYFQSSDTGGDPRSSAAR